MPPHDGLDAEFAAQRELIRMRLEQQSRFLEAQTVSRTSAAQQMKAPTFKSPFQVAPYKLEDMRERWGGALIAPVWFKIVSSKKMKVSL